MSKKKSEPKLGEQFRKLQPKLRMIANGNAKVNTIRAEQSSSIAVINQTLLKQTPICRGDDAVPIKQSELPQSVKRGHLKEVPANVYANVFIETLDASAQKDRLPGERARKATLVTARVPLSRLKTIAASDNVAHVELGEPLATPTPVVSAAKVGAPSPSLRKFGSAQQHKGGEGVLVGIIDVQGFDFSHPDFLDDKGRTRFVRIWDQGAPDGFSRPAPKGSPQFAYGAELRDEHMN